MNAYEKEQTIATLDALQDELGKIRQEIADLRFRSEINTPSERRLKQQEISLPMAAVTPLDTLRHLLARDKQA